MIRTPKPVAALAVLAALTLSLAAPAARAGRAEEAAVRTEAKALGKAGLTLFDKGDYAGALENFRRAYAMYPAPTLGVFTARSLVKLGKLLEAREIYGRVVDTPLERGADAAFRHAVQDARAERAALASRIPTLTLAVRGAPAGAPVAATLDDKPLTPGAEVEVDPGEHRLAATAADAKGDARVTVAEGERKRVALDLVAPAPPPPAPLAEPAAPASSPLRTAGFVGVGVGGLGLLAGGALAIAAVAEKGSLDAKCPTPTTCAPSASGSVSTYDTLRTASAIALYAGAGVAAVGVVVLIAAPRREPAPAAAIVVGPGSLGVAGRF